MPTVPLMGSKSCTLSRVSYGYCYPPPVLTARNHDLAEKEFLSGNIINAQIAVPSVGVMFPDNATLRRLLPRLQTKLKLSLPSR